MHAQDDSTGLVNGFYSHMSQESFEHLEEGHAGSEGDYSQENNNRSNDAIRRGYNPINIVYKSGSSKTWADPRDCGFQNKSNEYVGVSVQSEQVFLVNVPGHMFEANPACLSSVKATTAYAHNAVGGTFPFYTAVASLMSMLFDTENRALRPQEEERDKKKKRKKKKKLRIEEEDNMDLDGEAMEDEESDEDAQESFEPCKKKKKWERDSDTFNAPADKDHGANKLQRYHMILEMLMSGDGTVALGARVWKVVTGQCFQHSEHQNWTQALKQNMYMQQDNESPEKERTHKSSTTFLSDAQEMVCGLGRRIQNNHQLRDEILRYDNTLLDALLEETEESVCSLKVANRLLSTVVKIEKKQFRNPMAPERLLNPLYSPDGDDDYQQKNDVIRAGLFEENSTKVRMEVGEGPSSLHPSQMEGSNYYEPDPLSGKRKFRLPDVVLDNHWAFVLTPSQYPFAVPLPSTCGLGSASLPQCLIRAFVETEHMSAAGFSLESMAAMEAEDTERGGVVDELHRVESSSSADARRRCQNKLRGSSESSSDTVEDIATFARMNTCGSGVSASRAAVETVKLGAGPLSTKADTGVFVRQSTRLLLAHPAKIVQQWDSLMSDAARECELALYVSKYWRADQFPVTEVHMEHEDFLNLFRKRMKGEKFKLHEALASYTVGAALDLIEKRGRGSEFCLPPGLLHVLDSGRKLLLDADVDPSGLLSTHDNYSFLSPFQEAAQSMRKKLALQNYSISESQKDMLHLLEAPDHAASPLMACLQRTHCYVRGMAQMVGNDATPSFVSLICHAMGASSTATSGLMMIYGPPLAGKSKLIEAAKLIMPSGFVLGAGTESKVQGKHDAPMNGHLLSYDEFPSQLLDTKENCAAREEWKEQATNSCISHSTVAPRDAKDVARRGGLAHTDLMVCCERTEAKIICANKNPSLVSHSATGNASRSSDSASCTDALATRMNPISFRAVAHKDPAGDIQKRIVEEDHFGKIVTDFKVADYWKRMLILLGDIDPFNFKPDMRQANDLMSEMDAAAAGAGTGFFYPEPDARTKSMRRENVVWMLLVDVAVYMLTQEAAYLDQIGPTKKRRTAGVRRRGLKFDPADLLYLRQLIAVPPPHIIVFAWAMAFRNTLFAHEHATTMALAKMYKVNTLVFSNRMYKDTKNGVGHACAQQGLHTASALMARRRHSRALNPVARSLQDISLNLPGICDLELLYNRPSESMTNTNGDSSACNHSVSNLYSRMYPKRSNGERETSPMYVADSQQSESDANFAHLFSAQFLPVNAAGMPYIPEENPGPVSLDNRWLCSPLISGELHKMAADIISSDPEGAKKHMSPEVMADCLKNLMNRKVHIRCIVQRKQPSEESVLNSEEAVQRSPLRFDKKMALGGQFRLPSDAPVPAVNLHETILRKEANISESQHRLNTIGLQAYMQRSDNQATYHMMCSNRFPAKEIQATTDDEVTNETSTFARHVNLGFNKPKVLVVSVDAVVASIELECEARSALALEIGYTGIDAVPENPPSPADFYDVLIHSAMVVSRTCVWNSDEEEEESLFILPFISPKTNQFITFKIGQNTSPLLKRGSDNYTIEQGKSPFKTFTEEVCRKRGLAKDCGEDESRVVSLMMESGKGEMLRKQRLNMQRERNETEGTRKCRKRPISEVFHM